MLVWVCVLCECFALNEVWNKFFMINEAPYWSSSRISLYLDAMTIKAFYSILFYCILFYSILFYSILFYCLILVDDMLPNVSAFLVFEAVPDLQTVDLTLSVMLEKLDS